MGEARFGSTEKKSFAEPRVVAESHNTVLFQTTHADTANSLKMHLVHQLKQDVDVSETPLGWRPADRFSTKNNPCFGGLFKLVATDPNCKVSSDELEKYFVDCHNAKLPGGGLYRRG